MRDIDSMEKSTEHLRLALQLMTQHAVSPHPICYAVWYEYVVGANPALNAAIDALKSQNAVFDDQTTCALYQQYVENSGNVITGDIGTLIAYLNDSRREIEKLRWEILRAREDALADGLTGLLNRRGFDLALTDCFSTSSGTSSPSLLIADIDHFKKINDNHGHLFGDRVIRSVAKILRDNVKGKDIAARYGGEEFIVLLPETSLHGAHALAERIRTAISLHHFRRQDDRPINEQVTISIGVACCQPGEASVDFVERADAALYASKANGRNRVTVAGSIAAGRLPSEHGLIKLSPT